ncbi:hypothetical protein HH1059_07190 [Halorhodospira halochloris]|uniref:Uncharacterized protein n=1 Tax=Halorhodospira halochloris TaxID=1052 RepID=A0A0X8X987_HALHR|nr:hypothetical protein [Halorhodospira halochloris]MBK1651138.1 hypothetical protein [Halorhodospira halochloris]BAU57407.1 hypothetical protein HH1059_07190 [Halorhodospira halochloris]
MFVFTLAIIIMAALALLSGIAILFYSRSGNSTSSGREFSMAVFFVSALNFVSNSLVFGVVLGVNAMVGFY